MAQNPAIENLITVALSRWEGRTFAQILAHVERAAGQRVNTVLFGTALDRLVDRGIAIYIEGGFDDRPKWSRA